MTNPRSVLAFGPSLALAIMLAGCAGASATRTPDWVNGHSARYPEAAYLTGVGRADAPEAAEDRAYAAVARIFSAQISQRTQEWERYLQADQKGATATQRDISIDQVTRVSTDKAVEQVAITERYHDAGANAHYALAVMDRQQASATLRERIGGLDREIDGLIKGSGRTDGALGRARELHLAVRLLLLRDAYHTDLQIVDPSGRGADSLTRIKTVRLDLQRYLEQHVRIALDVTGDEPLAIRHALTQGLNEYGLPVGGVEIERADILIRGATRFESVGAMSQGAFVRWTARFDLLDRSTDQVIGSIARNGREGHVTESEARARALRAAQAAVSEDAGRTLAAFVFGADDELDSPLSREPTP